MLSRALESIKIRNSKKHDENQYIALIDDIINHGDMVDGRNGKTLTVFGSSMHFSLENGEIPLLTTKKVAWKTCLKELLWFISGSTNNDLLNAQNVKIWNGNSSREFLDKRGLVNNRVNDLGPVYGHQWRFFNADYKTCDDSYNGEGVDQLDYIIKQLKDPKERYSRRLLMSAWNPEQLDEMALPPCHVLVQFNVLPGDKLSCSLYQRSGDVGLGVPFNIASYSFLTHLIAFHCGLKAHEFCYHLGNCHIYDDHIEQLKIQRNKEPYKFPKLLIKDKKNDINDYVVDDFVIKDYKSHEPIKMNMRN